MERTVIELNSHLASIYPSNFEITDTILSAWRRMLKSVGCTNVTPYKKSISNVRTLIILNIFLLSYIIDNH
jgi:hypothetical protein